MPAGFDEVALLGTAARMLLDGRCAEGLDLLASGLYRLRQLGNGQRWETLIHEIFPAHPLRALVHQSPFCDYAFRKPRGYPGDAVMMDFAYGQDVPAGTSSLGRAIYNWEMNTPACRSARARRDTLARKIDQIGAEVGDTARILAVACGHLREAGLSSALRRGGVRELIGFDQDDASLAAVRNWCAQTAVRTVRGTILGILLGRLAFPGMHLIYSAGLYDYLQEDAAALLTAKLFGMLELGGRLLITNVTSDMLDRGYMEVCMDWELIHRAEPDMERLAGQIPPCDIGQMQTFRDSGGNMVFLELRRAVRA